MWITGYTTFARMPALCRQWAEPHPCPSLLLINRLNPAVDQDSRTTPLVALTLWHLLRRCAERTCTQGSLRGLPVRCTVVSTSPIADTTFVGGAMALRVCGTSLLFTLVGAQLLAGQVRQVSGRVTNSATGEGMAEATVAVAGTGIVAQTGNDGRYVLNAPEGDRTLVVRAIGFKR